jgi:hypothetical protein
MLKHIAVALLSSGLFAAQTPATQAGPPERKIEGNTITSTSDPAARIQLLNSPVYVGADRWILYGFSNCELHAFVHADSRKQVQRLYWVQFESYLPTRPDLHHTYDSPRHTQIGGLDFYVDTWVAPTSGHIKQGSDVEHIHTLLEPTATSCPPQ